jgi:hypothetical protein
MSVSETATRYRYLFLEASRLRIPFFGISVFVNVGPVLVDGTEVKAPATSREVPRQKPGRRGFNILKPFVAGHCVFHIDLININVLPLIFPALVWPDVVG